MDMQSPPNLFDLQVDYQANQYLAQAARWAKFLAIVGFVVCGLIFIVAIFAGAILGNLGSIGQFGASSMMSGPLISVIYIAFGLLYFFPCLYLFRFASRMQIALRNNDQGVLNSSFKSLKSCFRFVGIMTLVIIAIYLLLFIIAIFAMMMK
jgi:hypothetical protein